MKNQQPKKECWSACYSIIKVVLGSNPIRDRKFLLNLKFDPSYSAKLHIGTHNSANLQSWLIKNMLSVIFMNVGPHTPYLNRLQRYLGTLKQVCTGVVFNFQ